MNFKELSESINKNFQKMCKSGMLFRTNITGNEVWNTYLSSFKNENNNVFRDPESTEHNCNYCHSFIKRYGNVISIDDTGQNIVSLFSNLDIKEGIYKEPIAALANLIESSSIKDVFIETKDSLSILDTAKKVENHYRIGLPHNHKRYTKEEAELYGVVKPNEIRTFHHFYFDLPLVFVDKSGKSIESLTANYRDKYFVFKRGFEEIPEDTLKLVVDLINQGSLLDGTAHLNSVKEFIDLHNSLGCDPSYYGDKVMDIWYWQKTYKMNERTAKFKNTLVGVLCSEIAEGKELNKCCLDWNKRVDPVNYNKAKAPITKQQIELAKKFVEENGYEASFNRRLATIEDIKASEIKYMNSGNGEIQSVSIFDNVKATTSRHKRSEFENVEEVHIDKFMKDILPGCTNLEVFLKNNHEGNLVTLTTDLEEGSKPIFKWDNNYSWTFNGNLAGKSQIKEAVKSKGGKVDGVLRFSIMWAENDGDNSDLDAHCNESKGQHIYYSHKRSSVTEGNLDVDITQPKSQMPQGAVENITYPSLSKMKDGDYNFFVRQYNARNSKGFKAEIEFDGETYYYKFNATVRGDIKIATVTLKNGVFTIKHHLPETNQSKELWSLESNKFHKVNLVCSSPNHWGNNEVGNKHYIFALDKCKTDSPVRGFHNENLKPDLLQHRKVMEVLGSTNMIEPTDKQVSGVGFNSTVRNEVIVKISGTFKRMLKIKF